MGAAIDPSELFAKLLKDAVDLPIANGLTKQLPARADEERRLWPGTHIQIALCSVFLHCLGSAGVQWYQPRFAKLALANR